MVLLRDLKTLRCILFKTNIICFKVCSFKAFIMFFIYRPYNGQFFSFNKFKEFVVFNRFQNLYVFHMFTNAVHLE